MARTFNLEIMTPSKNFFNGAVESIIVTTPQGKEGFMANHEWTCMLLDAGKLMIKEVGAGKDDWRVASAAGGFIDVKDDVIIYTDTIEWDKGNEGRRSKTISGTDKKDNAGVEHGRR